MGKLAQLPFKIGKVYEIGYCFERVSPDCKSDVKTNVQIFNIKTQDDLNLLNHHWEQLNSQMNFSGMKTLPPYDITEDGKIENLKSIKSSIANILKKDDILSDNKIKEYTHQIIKYLHTNAKQLKLNL